MSEKCKLPEGVKIKPDGKNEMDPCFYQDIAIYRNVTVVISKCKHCGNIDVSWFRQEDTEEIPI